MHGKIAPQPTKSKLLSAYQGKLEGGEILPDDAQALIVDALGDLAETINQPQEAKPRIPLWPFAKRSVKTAEKGMYIYGDVGRGKSMLMQLFVDAVGDAALRVHFHEFMQDVQKSLHQLRQKKTRQPLRKIGHEIAGKCRVLCLDEMQIENIADAMIVGRLFEAIFEEGVVLVTTSNRNPATLYKGGLNRHRFEPFIDLITAHCDVIDLAGVQDYRDQGQENMRIFVNDPLGFRAAWAAQLGAETPLELNVHGRQWHIAHHKEKCTRISFAEACETAKGAADYQALADAVDVLFIAEIPMLTKEKNSAALRFVTLIDILYEAEIPLYLDLPAPLAVFHQDKASGFVFARTLSRLKELTRIALD